LDEALADMSHWEEFDHAIINADLEQAAQALAAVIGGTAGSTYAVTTPAHRQRIGRAITPDTESTENG
jgi:guanylate kinase